MSLVMMVTMFSTNVFASPYEHEGKCGKDVTYSFNANTGELLIKGKGKMGDYGPRIESKLANKFIKTMVTAGCTAGGACLTFLLNKKFNSNNAVGIEKNEQGLVESVVTSISGAICGAVGGTVGVAAILLSFLNNTRSTPWDKFKDKITSVTIKDGVTSIGKYAFDECKNVVL